MTEPLRVTSNLVEANQPHVVDIDERMNVVVRVIMLIDRIKARFLDKPYEAQTITNSIPASCVGIMTKSVRVA